MKKVLPKIWIGVAVLTIAGIATSIYAFQSNAGLTPVLESHRLFSMPGSTPYYWWINSDTVLLGRTPSTPTFVRHTISSEKEEPIPALDAFFQSTKGDWDTMRISPDGKWLLWSSKDQKTTAVFSLTDTKKQYRVENSDPVLPLWQLDSSGWVMLAVRNEQYFRAIYYSLNKPDKQDHAGVLTYPMPVGQDAANYRRATMTPEGMFMVQAWKGPNFPVETARLFASGVGANPANSRRISVAAPHANNGGEIFFAPNQSLVGWAMAIPNPIPLGKTYKTGFWVTKLRDTKSLGYLNTEQENPNSGPYNIQFTPDGKQISYVYQNTLFTIPVPF